MKRILSIILSVIMLVGALFCVNVSASAAQTVNFDTIYTHTYSSSNKNCNNTITLPADGVVYFEMEFPTSSYGSNCVPTLIVSSGGTQLFSRSVPSSTGKMFVFLDKGTYDFNIYMGSYTPVTSMRYCFQFRNNSNDKVQDISLGTVYTHYYNTNNAYGRFVLTQNSTVRFDLAKPVTSNGSKSNSYLYVYDASGTQVFRGFYAYSETNDEYYYSIRLPKGTYKFNYYASSPYSPNGYSVDSYAYYSLFKLSATAAIKPKTPKLSHTVKITKYSTSTRYDVSASYVDDQSYDGVELWTKDNNGAWKLKDSKDNTAYSRYTKVNIYVSSSSSYIVYYKVRTYSYYGTQKIYSDFSNILYTKTSLKPAKPTVKTKAARKAAKISWSKVSDVDGYVIYRSTKKKKGYKKVATVKGGSKVSYTNKKLISKKTYYYKVRSYKVVNGVTIYSNYSTAKKVKAK